MKQFLVGVAAIMLVLMAIFAEGCAMDTTPAPTAQGAVRGFAEETFRMECDELEYDDQDRWTCSNGKPDEDLSLLFHADLGVTEVHDRFEYRGTIFCDRGFETCHFQLGYPRGGWAW